MLKAFNTLRFRSELAEVLGTHRADETWLYEVDPIHAQWLQIGREFELNPSSIATGALSVASARMLANRYSVQTVLLDANNAVHELPTATEMRNAHLQYWEFEISGRAAALRDAALGRVDSLSEIESPRGIDNEADDASNELLYNGIRILGVASRLPQPVNMHFETISSPYSKVMQALSALTISTEFAVPTSEVLAQMPPLDA